MCRRFENYGSAIDLLREQPDPKVRVSIEYQFDGTKNVECRLTEGVDHRNVILDYVGRHGWALVACVAD